MKRAKNGRVPLPSCSQCIETPADHSGSVTKNCAPMKPWSTWNLAATVCDDVLGAYILFSTRIGLSLRNHSTFWDSECALGRIYFDSGSERSTDEMFTSRRGERRWPMPRLPNNPDRDFLASQSEDDINADIAEFLASRPPGVVELFLDPIVRMRIGSLITEAMNRPTRSRRRGRRVRLAKPRSAQ
jgi:hypothetical protein